MQGFFRKTKTPEGKNACLRSAALIQTADAQPVLTALLLALQQPSGVRKDVVEALSCRTCRSHGLLT